ncbi:MAG: NAD-dependent succinate-semialdehyde dehydrogenase [Chthoniobacterales bacterium]
MAIASINPATGETLRTFDPFVEADIEKKLARAALAFEHHRNRRFAERAETLETAAAVLMQDRDRYARTITLEMGKLFRDSIAEIEKCAACCRFYAQNGERFLEERDEQTSAARGYVRYDPIGAVLAIMPWNFPFWQVFRFAVPALMAGDVGLLKHAANVPQCALAIEEIFHRAGFDGGEFQALLVENAAVEKIIADPRVAAVTLTGSDKAGAAVASAAGRALKKSVLELGGSDPFIVLPSADLDAAVKTGVQARMVNMGQSCIAAKRFIIHEHIYDEFVSQFVQQMSELRVGDPFDKTTQVGPLSSEHILKGVAKQVEESVAAGAKLLTGGKRIERAGYFFEPTVLANVPTDSPAYSDEVFGPVASVFRVDDNDAAIDLANDHKFGLGASVWTNDPHEQQTFARQIESGMVFFNAMVASDSRLPFGGVKHSGYGRELSAEGIREFVNVKTVVVA